MDNKNRKQLEDKIITRIKTTMIGSLDAIEKKMSFLWAKDDANGDFMYNIFQEVRKLILDNGNEQIKKMREDLESYEINTMIYHTQFKTIQNERLKGG